MKICPVQAFVCAAVYMRRHDYFSKKTFVFQPLNAVGPIFITKITECNYNLAWLEHILVKMLIL